MEYLSRSLSALKDDRQFKFHPKCSKLNITHLIFADDLLLFSKADLYSVAKIYQCFQNFSLVSGLDANLSKCSVYLSGIEEGIKAQICSYLNFSEGVLPMKYLGLPLSTKRLSYIDCSSLIGKIQDKFQFWQQNRKLSYAGRLQLIKSVILGIQTFWISNYVLPIKVLERIDKLCSDFLWGKKIHLVAWNTICQEKRQGGLGLFSAKLWNQAAATKLLWMIHLKKDILWVKWIHENYLQTCNLWEAQNRVNDSWMWKQLLRVRDMLLNKFGSFASLKNAIDDCCCNDKIQQSAVYSKLAHSAATPVSWYETVWDNFNFPKHSFTVWLACNSKLLTKDRLCRLGILNPNQNCCVLCSSHQLETISHLFFDCQFSAGIWNGVIDWLNFKWRSCDWNMIIGWYSNNLKGKGSKKKLKRLALADTTYMIWQERNLRIFQSKMRSSLQAMDLCLDDCYGYVP
ncbi:uncharacterized protein LOC109840410 [Asparagus officinalis]|uniref:uncharacterized protein LOC109840410 n=1 Tax=Asparagus officinalis TaxID=4686 RepID=UPI00098E2181|nr:uncharacterized protein LOC109840410 [Asparagus officinalis]